MAAGRAAGAAVIGLATTLPREMINDKARIIIDGFTGFEVSDMLAVSRL